jgi:hypothetical protein
MHTEQEGERVRLQQHIRIEEEEKSIIVVFSERTDSIPLLTDGSKDIFGVVSA